MGAFELTNTLGILGAGRRPQWVQIPEAEQEALPTPSNGVYLENARVALLAVALRRRIDKRSAYVTVGTLDLTATYNVSIDGNLASYNAGGAGAASLADVLTGIRDAINGTPAVAAIVTATLSDEDGDGVDDTVVVIGDTEVDFYIVESATGAAVLSVVADAVSAGATLYARVRGQAKNESTTAPASSGWFKVSGGEWAVEIEGLIERVEVSGLSDGFVMLDSITGHASDGGTIELYARAWLGPAIEEGV